MLNLPASIHIMAKLKVPNSSRIPRLHQLSTSTADPRKTRVKYVLGFRLWMDQKAWSVHQEPHRQGDRCESLPAGTETARIVIAARVTRPLVRALICLAISIPRSYSLRNGQTIWLWNWRGGGLHKGRESGDRYGGNGDESHLGYE